eukprot:CAMPEP_0172897818 /NCGR_PEP_ID=MMETSP1075-20121228/158380_1 /TAXON_ID=2916 /ORGANISM="Ceratium fusus, Strain PA161109" /LENGTH=515 /DNA_ID=CAMNT_0013753491 /DNA_START=17 /DNA_END=1564 /DNA_ORIENTATION=-
MKLLFLLNFCGTWGFPDSLDPPEVWSHFGQILRIPRCSGNEESMRHYVREVAQRNGPAITEDSAGNVIVKRPASGGGAKVSQPVILQTHLDMVCEKNRESTHDWTQDPIATTLRDGWLVSDETTLGSDNGIGVAMSLALMESSTDALLPALEIVFTVEEETGLFGATNLDVSSLEGRRLLNFDSEEFGIIYIGCAGGGDATVNCPVDITPLASSSKPFRLELRGLRGGHSGADIHEQRGNALLLLARAIDELQQALPRVRLLQLEGGDKGNAIPRESSAILGYAPALAPQVEAALIVIEQNLKKEYGRIDPELRLILGSETVNDIVAAPLSEDSAQRLLDVLLALPNGPLKMSHEVAGLVETSSNVAKVRHVSDHVEVLCFPRSSIDSAMEDAQTRIARVAKLCGGTVNRTYSFPGWAPNASQELLLLAKHEFKKSTGFLPEVAAIHAGLECGIVGGKIPGMEMISFGPDIKGAHAPGERVHVESVQRTWDVARQLLARLALPGDASQSNDKQDL